MKITSKYKTLLLAGTVLPFVLVGVQAAADIDEVDDVFIVFDNDGANNGSEAFSVQTEISGSNVEKFRVTSSGATFTDGVTLGGSISLGGSILDENDAIVNIGESLDVAGSLTLTGSISDPNSAVTVADDFTVTNGGDTNLLKTTIVGATSVTGDTTINTNSVTSDTTIGVNGNDTSILSNTVNLGVGSYTTAVNVGSTTTTTTIDMAAGNSSLDMNDSSIRASVVDGTAETGAVVVANTGTQYVSDVNGLLTTATGDGSAVTAAMVVNGTNGVRGLVVEQSETTLSGGDERAASLTLSSNGATFSDPANGSPVQVHGVADGTADFDAVNVRQLYGGLAAVLASAPDLALTPGRSGAGVGIGSYGGFNAIGVRIGHMYDNGSVISTSISKSPTSKLAYRAGYSWSW